MSSNDSKYYSPSSSSSMRKSPSKSKSKSRSKSRSRFRKSKTPERKTSSFSPSSGGDSSEDDFPKFRPNWAEKSPGSSSADYPYEELREIDDLLRDARNLLKELIH